MSVGSRSGWVRLRSGLNNRTFGGNLKENKELNAHTDTPYVHSSDGGEIGEQGRTTNIRPLPFPCTRFANVLLALAFVPSLCSHSANKVTCA